MRNRDDESESSEIPMAPLIDVVFLLLIFFLVATNFSKTEVDYTVQIPKAGVGAESVREPKRMVVNLRKDGGIVVNGRVIDTENLPALVSNWHKENATSPAEIRADDGVEFGRVAKAFGVCKAAGVSQVNLAVQEADRDRLLSAAWQ